MTQKRGPDSIAVQHPGAGCLEAWLTPWAASCPSAPYLLPSDTVSDQPEQLLARRAIRKQVLTHTREEVPHSVAVCKWSGSFEDGKRTSRAGTVQWLERIQPERHPDRKGGGRCFKENRHGRPPSDGKVFDGRFIWSCSSGWCPTAAQVPRGCRAGFTAAIELASWQGWGGSACFGRDRLSSPSFSTHHVCRPSWNSVAPPGQWMGLRSQFSTSPTPETGPA